MPLNDPSAGERGLAGGRAAPRPWAALRILRMPSPSPSPRAPARSVDVNPVRSTPREQRRHMAGMHHSRDTGGG
jgi:hypothetical protein